jgi:acetoacetyl-CoA synthetase
MWNIATSVLLSGATLIVYDGAPAHPSVDAQFALAARTGMTYLGTSAGYLTACEKAGIRPAELHDLSALRSIGSTGSPLPASAFHWVYDAVRPDVLLGSLSGGTDVATGFIGSSPLLPVTAGELQRPNLGVAAASWNEDGQPVVGELGELVITAPMPSMPLFFWGDDDGARYRASYFETFPGVWRHGDFFEVNERGGCFVRGRSDAVLNRQGVRIGTAEIYRVVEDDPAVLTSLVVNLDLPGGGFFMPLFVVLGPGQELDADLEARLRRSLRAEYTPRHVPDAIVAVGAIPMTRSGKKMEIPVRRVLLGADPADVADPQAMADADAFADIARYARTQSDYSL